MSTSKLPADKFLCGYADAQNRRFYVSQLRGDGGKDWGYATHVSGALVMSKRQAAVFMFEPVPGRFCVS